MVAIMYLGNIVELTDAEYEQIMKCPNYKYITTSGYIVKGLDSITYTYSLRRYYELVNIL